MEYCPEYGETRMGLFNIPRSRQQGNVPSHFTVSIALFHKACSLSSQHQRCLSAACAKHSLSRARHAAKGFRRGPRERRRCFITRIRKLPFAITQNSEAATGRRGTITIGVCAANASHRQTNPSSSFAALPRSLAHGNERSGSGVTQDATEGGPHGPY